jgi:diguanylate cyclase (GGDEF)-like protein
MIHLPTLILVTLLVNALIGTYLFTVYKRKPKDSCFLYWSLSCGCFVAGGLASSLRAYDLPVLYTYFLADLFLVLAPLLIFVGLCQFSRIKVIEKAKFYAVGLILIFILVLWISHTELALNNLIVGITIAIIFAACALLLERSIIVEPIFTRLLKYIFVLHSIVIIAQTILISFTVQHSETYQLATSAIYVLLSHVLLTTLTALILPWLSFLQLERKLTLKSQRDGLTKIANREHFINQAELLWNNDSQHKVVLMMIDIDHFKKINDEFGHAAGDYALKETVKVLSKQLRSSDLFGRVGGEEFAVALPRTNEDTGQHVAKRLLKAVEINQLQFDKQHINITISIGMVTVTPELESFEKSYKSADNALYLSKTTGRNKASVY